MRFSTLATLFWSTVVVAQVDYAELSSQFLQTSDPTTPLPQGFPWGTRTVNNTNAYDDPPLTGVIRSYNFTISRSQSGPDGYVQDVMLINGQFPGPLIEANWGDTIQVTVHNQIFGPEEGTAMHWHGFLQRKTPWMDGVPGVMQCPIPPGQSFTYTFIADLYGTSWYHSHYSAQYSSGLSGPMVIHGPDTVRYDIDKGPIILSDWYHKDYLDIVDDVVSTDFSKVAPRSDNNLINGRNNFNCSMMEPGDNSTCRSDAGISTFEFTPGKLHRLRLINAGAEGMQKFSIDGHSLTVIAYDFVPIIPYETNVVTLSVGQRADVLVRGIQGATGAYTMRSSISADPCGAANNPDVTALVYYRTEHLARGSNSTAWPELADHVKNICDNDPLNMTVPWFPISPDLAPPLTKTYDIDFHANETGFNSWYFGGVNFRANYNQPILMLSNLGNNSYPDSPQWNVENVGNNSSIRMIIRNTGPIGFLAHPMHMHGHNMYLLASGKGDWDGQTITNAANPMRRDTFTLPANGHMVFQFDGDNPGVWPLHCHIAWHVSQGLYISILERPDDIFNLQIPSIMAQTCRDWASFTNRTVINQIDSGL